MPDIAHYWGEDVTPASDGDFLSSAAVNEANERVLRRLLTAPGDYVWHPAYGAGLPQEIGQLVDVRRIEGIVLQHLALESAVSQAVNPKVTVKSITNGVHLHIEYTIAASQERALLQFGLER